MSDLRQVIQATIWSVIEKNYNVDRKDPRVLTYKQIMMDKNPFDELTTEIENIVGIVITQLQDSKKTSKDEDSYDYSYGFLYPSDYEIYGGED